MLAAVVGLAATGRLQHPLLSCLCKHTPELFSCGCSTQQGTLTQRIECCKPDA